MASVADVLRFVESVAPAHMKEDWDNVGLLCGRGRQEVKRILVALDPFRNVIDEAVRLGADLIVTHHPLIFGELRAVTEDTETGRCLLKLIENGIAAINAHTNLDLAPGGVNDVLARKLGLENICVLNPEGTDEKGRLYGLLRMGTVEEQPLEQFLKTVRENLNCEGLRYVNPNDTVRRVAVGGGSCSGAMEQAIEAGCDTFVTADVKYNGFRSAYEQGLNLIDAGHFHTENPVMSVLAEKMRKAFPDVEVILSENHADCMKFY